MIISFKRRNLLVIFEKMVPKLIKPYSLLDLLNLKLRALANEQIYDLNLICLICLLLYDLI